MKKSIKNPKKEDYKEITKYIFKCLTIEQIAKEMHCSYSCVTYKMANLFNFYGVKSRNEFIIYILGEIIHQYKVLLDRKNEEIDCLEDELFKLKRILHNITALKTDKSNDNRQMDFWLEKAKSCI